MQGMRTGPLLAAAVVLALAAGFYFSTPGGRPPAPTAPPESRAEGQAPGAETPELSSGLSGDDSRVAEQAAALDPEKEDPDARAEADASALPPMTDLAAVPMAAASDTPRDVSEDYYRKKYSGKGAKERKQARDDLQAQVDAGQRWTADELAQIRGEIAWLKANP